MTTNTGAKWQPVGEQFVAACRVCFYGDCCRTTQKECINCMREKEPGFVFDPDKYIVMFREFSKKRYFINSSDSLPMRLDMVLESEELKSVKEERDYWKGIADKALQSIVSIAERMADSNRK